MWSLDGHSSSRYRWGVLWCCGMQPVVGWWGWLLFLHIAMIEGLLWVVAVGTGRCWARPHPLQLLNCPWDCRSSHRHIVTVHGFPIPSSPCLVCVRVRMCEQVSVGVCDWGWFAPAESHHRWAISVPVTLSPLSDPCSVCGRRLRSVLVPRFLSPAASWTPIAGPWLPIASLRYPPQPYGKLRICLRKAPFLPTEAPPLPYGKLRFCLRKLRLCPTESSV